MAIGPRSFFPETDHDRVNHQIVQPPVFVVQQHPHVVGDRDQQHRNNGRKKNEIEGKRGEDNDDDKQIRRKQGRAAGKTTQQGAPATNSPTVGPLYRKVQLTMPWGCPSRSHPISENQLYYRRPRQPGDDRPAQHNQTSEVAADDLFPASQIRTDMNKQK